MTAPGRAPADSARAGSGAGRLVGGAWRAALDPLGQGRTAVVRVAQTFRAWRAEPGDGRGGGRVIGPGPRRQGPPALRLEAAPERLGQRGQFGGVGDRIRSFEGAIIALRRLVGLRLEPAQLGGARRLGGPDGQHGQALQGLRVAGNPFDQPLERGPLGLGLAPAGGEPRAEGEHLGLGEAVGGQVRQAALAPPGAVGCPGPAEPCPPDHEIIGATRQASVEPSRGFVEPTLVHGEVRACQPDAVVVRRGVPAASTAARIVSNIGGAWSIRHRSCRSPARSGELSQPPCESWRISSSRPSQNRSWARE